MKIVCCKNIVTNSFIGRIISVWKHPFVFGRESSAPAFKPKTFGYHFKANAFFLFLLLTSFYSQAQTASATWPLTSNGIANVVGSVSATNIGAGSGINSLAFDSNGANAKGWNSKNQNVNEYFEYTISPTIGSDLIISGVTLSARVSDNTMTSAIYYSLDGFISSFQLGADIIVNTSSTSIAMAGLSIAVNDGQTLTIRVYGWNAKTPNSLYYNKDVLISGTTSAITNPLLTINPTSLNFGYVDVNTISSELTYILSGTNLDGTDISIVAPTNFEISTSSGSGFGNTITLSYVGSTLGNTTIHVRFTPTSANFNYVDVISNTGGGASAQTVAVSGTTIVSCMKNAVSVHDSQGVLNPTDAIGPQNNIGALLDDSGDALVLDLTGGSSLSIGNTIDVWWRGTSPQDGSILVEISPDDVSWTTVQTYVVTNGSVWYTLSIPLAVDATYIRFTSQSKWEVEIDALEYDALPTLTCPADITVNNDPGNCGAIVNYTVPVGTDNCPGTSTVLTSGLGSGLTFPIGTSTEIYTATDASGQTTSCSFTVTVIDTEAPTITCPTNETVLVDAGLCTASGVDLGTPTTDDNCGVASVTNDASEPYSLGNTTVTWTVTDDTGLTATCEQIVTVNPEELISITLEDLGAFCQSGETGSQTLITWNLIQVSGTVDWTFDYTIYEGVTLRDSGTDIAANGDAVVTYDAENQTVTDKTFTITISNVRDNCDVAEGTGDKNDTVVLHGLPEIGSFN